MPARPATMPHAAPALAHYMTLGWNLGNSLEVASGETAWGNPPTTKALIDAVCDAGFTTVRIPCHWSGFVDASSGTNYRITDSRMTRVKEIVDYCISNGLYVILNSHHDWIEAVAKNGLIPYLWDDGYNFPLMDRNSCTVGRPRDRYIYAEKSRQHDCRWSDSG